jgi:pimeloyl-ACP methyl ester carboxylesterase
MEATIHGARIHYERDAEGLPVLLLHAGVADSRMWEPQVAAFAKHFDVIRPDMRGFGQSALPPVHWSPVADLLGLVDELGLKPAHIVGCSMGSQVAIDFALQHGERISKLVLVGPAISGAQFGPKYPDLWTESNEAEKAHDVDAIIRADMRLWLDGPRRPSGYVKEPHRSLFFDMGKASFANDFESAPIDQLDPPAAGRLHEISAPTLVVVGDQDAPPIFDAVELLMEKIPHARKVVIHDAAHLPNLEHPEEFNSAVLGFLLAD